MNDFEYAIKEFERALKIAEDYDCENVKVPAGAAKVALVCLKAMVKEDANDQT